MPFLHEFTVVKPVPTPRPPRALTGWCLHRPHRGFSPLTCLTSEASTPAGTVCLCHHAPPWKSCMCKPWFVTVLQACSCGDHCRQDPCFTCSPPWLHTEASAQEGLMLWRTYSVPDTWQACTHLNPAQKSTSQVDSIILLM